MKQLTNKTILQKVNSSDITKSVLFKNAANAVNVTKNVTIKAKSQLNLLKNFTLLFIISPPKF